MYKASVKLAKEFGKCEGYNELKVSKGILPIHTYSKHLDDIIGNELKYDWSELAKDIEKYGIRNSTLLAIAPVETSSQILNSTNGIEPPRGYISYKESKNGIFKQLIPGGPRLRKAYQLLWDIQSPKGYLTIAAILNKYMCQSISTNTSYNPKHYKDEKIPMSILLTDLLYAYKLGIKTLYYCNTNKGSNDTTLNEESSSCESGACSI
jgi:ribonucleoside-diphosphate reductase alpha chain